MKVKMTNHLKPCLTVSCVIMLIALVMTFTGHGMDLGIDFTGGTIMTYNMGADFDVDVVEAALKTYGVTNAQIAKTGDGMQAQIRIADNENTDELRDSLEEELAKTYPDIAYVDISRVGAVAGRDLINNAIKSLCIAALLMLAYIALRFDFYSGVAAVIGLIHDVLIMLSFVVILHSIIRVETTFIAALLTIVGYSINNTIIIFDRIRENAKKAGTRSLPREEIVNLSVTECLPRTLNTTVTTLLTVVTLYVLGVSSVRQFALPLIIGILSGTYSANLINGYVWVLLMNRFAKGAKRAKA